MHDAGEPERALAALEDLAKSGQLTLRVYAMVADDSAALAQAFAAALGSRLWGGTAPFGNPRRRIDPASGRAYRYPVTVHSRRALACR